MTEHERLRGQKRAFEQDVAAAQALERLRENRDFQSVVAQGFLNDACLDAVREAASVRAGEVRQRALERAVACQHLARHLHEVASRGEYAREQMQALDAAIAHERHTGG